MRRTTFSPFIKSVGKLVLLYLAFQVFWLVFYFLSNNGLIKYGKWATYSKQAIANSIGFACLALAYLWLFPFFLAKKKYLYFSIVTIILVYAFGKLQYKAQDWVLGNTNNTSTVYTPAKMRGKSFPAVSLKQAKGADVYTMLYVAVYLLLGLGFAYMQDNLTKEKKARALEKEKLQAELKLLRYQINPHFLFNTINDIYYLAIIQSNKTADALLQLSHILRYVLDEKEPTVSIAQEIEYLEQYIQLHQFRFPEEKIEMNIALDYKAKQLKIAPLLLITFVENAFKHGSSGTSDAPIIITLQNKNRKFHYEVINKIGTQVSKERATGIGLANLKRRLELLYPNRHSLNILQEANSFKATLELDTND